MRKESGFSAKDAKGNAKGAKHCLCALRDKLCALFGKRKERRVAAAGARKAAAPGALATLEETLEYAFRDRALLEMALTAPSFRATRGVTPCADNQRLEFLGDAVLGLLAADHLFNAHTDADEGVLTVQRSRLTSGKALARLARRAGLGVCLRIGVSDEKTGGQDKDRLLAEAMEAVFGAAWCDGGLEAVRRMFGTLLRLADGLLTEAAEDNPKGTLQEMAQRQAWGVLPTYELVSASGPHHAPVYVMRVRVEGGRGADGEGRSKREAEVNAARSLLALLKAEGIE